MDENLTITIVVVALGLAAMSVAIADDYFDARKRGRNRTL